LLIEVHRPSPIEFDLTLRRAAFFERLALLGTRRLELLVALLEMLLRVPRVTTPPPRRR
jgi:hypothetical protein